MIDGFDIKMVIFYFYKLFKSNLKMTEFINSLQCLVSIMFDFLKIPCLNLNPQGHNKEDVPTAAGLEGDNILPMHSHKCVYALFKWLFITSLLSILPAL